MNKILLSLTIISGLFPCKAQNFVISKETLKDKIKGGWAGQTIGVTYGAPVEFRFQGTMINDYQKLNWYDGLLKKTMLEDPGVYDDLYLDITFVEVFEKEGLNAPASSHAKAMANAGYMLWHANQAARYNVLNGILPPLSGHWTNNPHADCIDYQIEADYAGLMSPSMPNTASEFSDKIGHIMNYGDGWYGGVYVGALYALAFQSNDIPYIINEALKAIPKNTKYYQCLSDVILWHKKFPDDWKQTWFEIQKKWTDDIGCPEGVYSQFNIDATVNSAYVILGLLYGKGDFTKTMEITTRCGQDADCNPSTAAGILGTILGYNRIPPYWKMGLKEIEDIDFKYTRTSLNKVYELSYKHALTNILNNGGKVEGEQVIIKSQVIKTVKWEQSFVGIYPKEKRRIEKNLEDEFEFEFSGTGFILQGEYKPKAGIILSPTDNATAQVEVTIDNKVTEVIKLPVQFTTRRYEPVWKYPLPESTHRVKLRLINPDKEKVCRLSHVLIYESK